MTWWCRASSARVLPSAAPSRPPTPVSISSKTSVGHAVDAGEHGLGGEGHPRELAARGDLAERPGASPGLARRAISTRSAPDSGGGAAVGSSPSSRRLDLDGRAAPLEAQRLEPRLDRPGELLGRLAPGRRERGGGGLQRAAQAAASGRVEAASGRRRRARSRRAWPRSRPAARPARRARSGTGRPAAGRGPAGPRSSRAAPGRRPSPRPRSRKVYATSRVSSASRSRVVAASASSGTAAAIGSRLRATRLRISWAEWSAS